MPLTDAQVDQLLGQHIAQHEGERAGHCANLAKLGVLLESSTPGSPAEARYLAEIAQAKQSLDALALAIDELGKTAGKPNSAQRLKSRADEVIALAEARKPQGSMGRTNGPNS